MAGRTLDEGLVLRMLGALAREPATTPTLATALATPERTIRRYVGRLVDRGLAVRHEDQVLITNRGRCHIQASRLETGIVVDLPAEVLRLLRVPKHRYILGLELCAWADRQGGTDGQDFPFFLCYGPGADFKTTVAGLALRAVGGDPVAHTIYLTRESDQSVIYADREGRRGNREPRETLSAGLIVIEEFLDGDARTRRRCLLYIQGVRRVSAGNGRTLDVRPVTILCMNPREGDGLARRTTLRYAMLRRGIVINLGAVPVPDEIADTTDELWEQAEAIGPIQLGAPRPFPAHFRQVIARALRAMVAPDGECARNRVANPACVRHLVNGALRLFPADASPATALVYALVAYGEAIETNPDWLVENWREELERVLVHAELVTPRSTAATVPIAGLPEAPTSAAVTTASEARSVETGAASTSGFSEEGRLILDTLAGSRLSEALLRDPRDVDVTFHWGDAYLATCEKERVEPNAMLDALSAVAVLDRAGIRLTEDVAHALVEGLRTHVSSDIERAIHFLCVKLRRVRDLEEVAASKARAESVRAAREAAARCRGS